MRKAVHLGEPWNVEVSTSFRRRSVLKFTPYNIAIRVRGVSLAYLTALSSCASVYFGIFYNLTVVIKSLIPGVLNGSI